jgi:hypothetical protein
MKRQTDIDFDREFVKVHRVKAGLNAASKKNTIAVGEMMNPLRQAASRRNPRSPAFAEPAIIDLAISRFVWVDWFPVMRGTHQMLWCRVRLAGG